MVFYYSIYSRRNNVVNTYKLASDNRHETHESLDSRAEALQGTDHGEHVHSAGHNPTRPRTFHFTHLYPCQIALGNSLAVLMYWIPKFKVHTLMRPQ